MSHATLWRYDVWVSSIKEFGWVKADRNEDYWDSKPCESDEPKNSFWN